ncbi:MAG: DUF7341 domain-containing protein [Marmoricola sp.]
MSLRDNCHRLCREHLTMGPKGPISVPALLDQLEAAVTANEHGSGGTSGGVALPIGEGALALLQDIEHGAREHQHELIPSFAGTLKAVIESWAVEDINAEWMAFLEHVTLDWIDAINAIVAPTKPPRKLTLPCPACSVLYHEGKPALRVHCWDEDGGMLKIWQWTAECVGCGAGWPPEQMGWLVKAVHAG